MSNYVGKVPFAAVNLMSPLLLALMAPGLMMGTGGSAIVAQNLGEGKRELANRYFSLLTYATLAAGGLFALLAQLGLPQVVTWLGAQGRTFDDCILYSRIFLLAIPLFMLQLLFQSFFVTAEKPRLGLAFTVAAGLTNVALDALFIVVFDWGLAGAAAATSLSVVVGGLGPLIYFARPNDSLLRLGRTGLTGHVLVRSCFNGSSEMMSTLSGSIVTTLYNYQLMRLVGEDGVAAYGVIQYVGFVFAAIFLGYSVGIAPVIGFHYGAGNDMELRSLFRKGVTLVVLAGGMMSCASWLASDLLTSLFVGYDPALRELTLQGLRIYAASFLFSGFNIFGSAFFTALGDGATSAVISFLRSLVFESSSVVLMSLLFGLDGLWSAIIVAELLAAAVTVLSFAVRGKKYRYL